MPLHTFCKKTICFYNSGFIYLTIMNIIFVQHHINFGRFYKFCFHNNTVN